MRILKTLIGGIVITFLMACGNDLPEDCETLLDEKEELIIFVTQNMGAGVSDQAKGLIRMLVGRIDHGQMEAGLKESMRLTSKSEVELQCKESLEELRVIRNQIHDVIRYSK